LFTSFAVSTARKQVPLAELQERRDSVEDVQRGAPPFRDWQFRPAECVSGGRGVRAGVGLLGESVHGLAHTRLRPARLQSALGQAHCGTPAGLVVTYHSSPPHHITLEFLLSRMID